MSITRVGKSGRVYVRRFDHEEAQARYEAGETIAALAAEFEVTYRAVWNVATESGRTAVRKSQENAKRRYEGQGICDDCGGPMNLGGRLYNGARRCNPCSALAQATSVREGELRCVICKQWKPDYGFPHNKRERGARRGRHTVCRSCQTVVRRDHRRRNREAENAYQRAYKRRRRTVSQKATSAIRDDGTRRAQPTTEEVGKPAEGKAS